MTSLVRIWCVMAVLFIFPLNTQAQAAGGSTSEFWENSPFSFAIPLTFLSVRAYQLNDKVNIEWSVEEDCETKEYQVEKSTDGRNFYRSSIVKAAGNSQVGYYAWQDQFPANGMNYYRVRSIGTDGTTNLSRIVSINVGALAGQITILPNPVTTNLFTLNIVKNTKDNFTIKLLSINGQLIREYSVWHPGGSSTQILQLPASLSNQLYILNIYGLDKKQANIKLYVSPMN